MKHAKVLLLDCVIKKFGYWSIESMILMLHMLYRVMLYWHGYLDNPNVWKTILIWMVSLFIQENIITMVINLGWTHQYRTQNNYNRDKDKYRLRTEPDGREYLLSSEHWTPDLALHLPSSLHPYREMMNMTNWN